MWMLRHPLFTILVLFSIIGGGVFLRWWAVQGGAGLGVFVVYCALLLTGVIIILARTVLYFDRPRGSITEGRFRCFVCGNLDGSCYGDDRHLEIFSRARSFGKIRVRCRSCGATRIANDIEVRSIRRELRGAAIQDNYQYCGDNPACKKKAELWKGHSYG